MTLDEWKWVLWNLFIFNAGFGTAIILLKAGVLHLPS